MMATVTLHVREMKLLNYLFGILLLAVLCCCSSHKKENIPEDDQNFQNPLNPQLNALNEAIQADPENADYYFKRAKVYFSERNYRTAMNDINQAIHLDNTIDAYHVFLAKVYKALDKEALALKVAKHAESMNSKDPELYILMAQIYSDMDDKKNASYYLNESSILAPLHSEIFVLKGNLLARQGDTALALSHYLSALQKDAENVDALKELAKIYDARKKYDSSMVFIVRGRSLSNHEPFFDFLNGKVLEHLNLTASAMTSYETALKNDPTFFLASMNLGNIYYKLDSLHEAQQWYAYTLKYNSDLPLANTRLGEVLEKSGRPAEAIPYYERASLIDTGNVKLKASLKKLYELYPELKRRAEPTAVLPVVKDSVVAIPKTPATLDKAPKKTIPISAPAAETRESKDTDIAKPVVRKEPAKAEKEISPKPAVSEEGNKKKNDKEGFNLKGIFKKEKNKDTL